MDNNTTILNIVKKQIKDYGQEVGWNEKGQGAIDYKPTKFFKGIVKYDRQLVQNNDYYIELKDKYEFILLDKVEIDEYLVWNNSKYHILSVDNTIKGLYKCYGQFQTMMNTHTYSIIINNENPIQLKVGDKVQLSCTCKDNDTIDTKPTITYKSSNTDIASVDNTGLIKSISEGTVDITVTYNNVSASIKCNVSKADEYSISCDDISVDMGSSVQLSPICMKNGVEVDSPTITYTSENSSIANCDENGLVNGVSSGTTTINIEWQGVIKTINITVNNVQVEYKITGSDTMVGFASNNISATYTLSPSANNIIWTGDEDSNFYIEIDMVSLTQSGSSCTINVPKSPSDDSFVFVLLAKVGDIELARKTININRK